MKYLELVRVYQELESTTKRLEKTDILVKLLETASKSDLKEIVYLIQGRVFPLWDEKKIGMSSKLVLRAVSSATGNSREYIEKLMNKVGDLGKVAEELISEKKQMTLRSKQLDVKDVFNNIRKLAELQGAGTVDRKIRLVSELLTSAKPVEARFIVRTVLEVLRVGVAGGIVRDSIANAFKKDVVAIDEAADLLVDYGEVAVLAKENRLKHLKLDVGKPIKLMLAIKADTLDEAIKKLGKPIDVEYKYDGFRIQAHKDKGKILLFTRKMEDVTKQFPDVVKFVKDNVRGDSFILDLEAVGFDAKTKKYLPFQNVSQRIKRKHGIEEMARKFPVVANVFDIMYYNGKSFIDEPFKKRRELLEKVVKKVPRKIVLAKNLISSDEKKIEKFFKESLRDGNEGIMLKKVDAKYKAGRYVGYMIKFKPSVENLDLVIIGGEWGEGKRAKWLSSFILGCKSEDKFLELGKVGTGIKERSEEGVTFDYLTKMIIPLITKTKGKTVRIKPKIVIEVGYEEIQKSPTYSSGYGLRFPRVIRLRNDKGIDEINNLDDVKKFYKAQRK